MTLIYRLSANFLRHGSVILTYINQHWGTKKKSMLSNYLESVGTEGTAAKIRPSKMNSVLFKSSEATESLKANVHCNSKS